MLKAGTSFIDISPEKGVQLWGYPHAPRHNEGTHDPLYAACLYLNTGRDEMIFITVDLLYIGKKYVKMVRERLGKNTMITATHTHSGPCAGDSYINDDGSRGDSEEYKVELVDKLVRCAQNAMENTFDAEIGSYTGSCSALRYGSRFAGFRYKRCVYAVSDHRR